jgi:hypothetical protein
MLRANACILASPPTQNVGPDEPRREHTRAPTDCRCGGRRHSNPSIKAALKRQLAKGDKALVGNTGYRYLKTISQDHFGVDLDKVEEDKRFDGIFVLRTNTDLTPLGAMLCYKQLWTVEANLPHRQAPVLEPADLPQARRDHAPSTARPPGPSDPILFARWSFVANWSGRVDQAVRAEA